MPREFVCVACQMLFWEEFKAESYSYQCPSCKRGNSSSSVNVWATDSTGLAMQVDNVLDSGDLTYLPSNVPPGALEHYRQHGIQPKGAET